MMPALALIGVSRGRGRLLPLPIPLILLWPFVAVAFLFVAVAGLFTRRPVPWLAATHLGCRAFCHLGGLKVDVQSKESERVFVWFL